MIEDAIFFESHLKKGGFMRTIPAICGITFFLFVLAVRGAIIFEDNFDNSDEWAPYIGSVETAVQDGRFIVENTGNSLALLKHSADYSDFTYTISLDAQADNFSKAGILFCWKDNLGGYELTISALKQYALGKWTRNEENSTFNPSTVDLGYNSFINSSGANELSVSKSGSTLRISCNGVLLTEVVDESFASGDIGMIVNSGETVSFDYVKVTDEFMETGPKAEFVDDFEDGDLNGWGVFTQAGTIENSNGALRFNAGGENSHSIIYTNGQYEGAPVKVIVNKESGSDSAFYGIMLLELGLTMSGNSYTRDYSSFTYYINASRRYAAFSSNATSFSPVQSTHIDGTRDTLEITPDYKFVVNGDTMPDIDMGEGFNFNAVALVADSNVTVSFDEFSAGPSATSVIASKPHGLDKFPKKKQFELGGTGIIYDPRGREIARVTDNNYQHVMKNLGNGSFIIITKKNGKHFPIRRAVVVK